MSSTNWNLEACYEVRVSYWYEGEAVAGATYRRVEDAIDDTIELSPGRYEVRFEIDEGSTDAPSTRRVERILVVPSEGRVHFRLDET